MPEIREMGTEKSIFGLWLYYKGSLKTFQSSVLIFSDGQRKLEIVLVTITLIELGAIDFRFKTSDYTELLIHILPKTSFKKLNIQGLLFAGIGAISYIASWEIFKLVDPVLKRHEESAIVAIRIVDRFLKRVYKNIKKVRDKKL